MTYERAFEIFDFELWLNKSYEEIKMISSMFFYCFPAQALQNLYGHVPCQNSPMNNFLHR